MRECSHTHRSYLIAAKSDGEFFDIDISTPQASAQQMLWPTETARGGGDAATVVQVGPDLWT